MCILIILYIYKRTGIDQQHLSCLCSGFYIMGFFFYHLFLYGGAVNLIHQPSGTKFPERAESNPQNGRWGSTALSLCWCIRCMRVNGNFASNRNGTNMAKPSKSGLLFSSLDTGTFQAIQYEVTQRQKQRQTLGPQSGDSTTNQHRFLLHAESALCVMISLRDLERSTRGQLHDQDPLC